MHADAQQLPRTDPPLERYFQYPLLNGRSPAAPAMSPDGSKIVFGWNQTGERRLDVWIMDYPSGEKRMILEASRIEPLPRQDDTRTDEQRRDEDLYDSGISGFQWSPDGQEFLFTYKGRAWRMRPDGSSLEAIFDTAESIGSVQFSPDGRYISFLRGSNLFRLTRGTGALRQLTFISAPNTSIDGYAWSPNGAHIVVTWSDWSKLGSHVMMDFTKDRAEVVNIRRMWHGEQSVNSKVGIIGADGGLVQWVTGIPAYHWRVALDWAPDSSRFAVGWFSEDFKEYTLSSVLVDRPTLRLDVHRERAPKNYLPDFRKVVWGRDSRTIYFTTDVIDGQFGHRSVFAVQSDGRGLRPIYAENHDVAALMRPKDSDRLFLVTLARSPLKSEITIVGPDGRRTVHLPVENGMSTPQQFDDAGHPLVSDDGRMVATMASTRTMNPELFAVEPRQARLTQSQRPEFAKIRWAEMREVTFKAPDGQTVHALLIQDPNLDKSKKHPAFISSLYANSAKKSWSGYFENYAAMELGMVVLQVDFRASWGQGGEFNSGYYKSMGIVDADEAVAAKDFLVSLGYVNPERVGVWGWSYGGFLTAMIQLTRPNVFHAGVAVNSVTDWTSYNEWYTRRRLGMQSDDPEVYKATSPVHHAAGLENHLLLVHGMLDDNVLFQDTARLIQRLIENGKYFDQMAYPRDDHGIGRNESRPHVHATIMRYLYWRLNEPTN
jgi:dipeptidyl-peptidase 4